MINFFFFLGGGGGQMSPAFFFFGGGGGQMSPASAHDCTLKLNLFSLTISLI